jgi:hypothetical protein
MQVARNGLSAQRWVVIALVGALGLMVVASGSNAVASGPGHAVTAKKCKKHKRSAAASKKKKKCKKVHHVVLPAPAPLVRGTLAFTNTSNNEVDLHAFDASGNHAGWDYNVNPPSGSLVNNIPNARHNGDVGSGGPSETFTDDIFVLGGPSNRQFSFVACLYGDNPGSYTASFTGVTAAGQSNTIPLNGPGIYSLTVPGGPPIPFNPC